MWSSVVPTIDEENIHCLAGRLKVNLFWNRKSLKFKIAEHI